MLSSNLSIDKYSEILKVLELELSKLDIPDEYVPSQSSRYSSESRDEARLSTVQEEDVETLTSDDRLADETILTGGLEDQPIYHSTKVQGFKRTARILEDRVLS